MSELLQVLIQVYYLGRNFFLKHGSETKDSQHNVIGQEENTKGKY